MVGDNSTRFRTLLAQIRPYEVVQTKDGLTQNTLHVLRNELPAYVIAPHLYGMHHMVLIICMVITGNENEIKSWYRVLGC
jgi:hypothetical protein